MWPWAEDLHHLILKGMTVVIDFQGQKVASYVQRNGLGPTQNHQGSAELGH